MAKKERKMEKQTGTQDPWKLMPTGGSVAAMFLVMGSHWSDLSRVGQKGMVLATQRRADGREENWEADSRGLGLEVKGKETVARLEESSKDMPMDGTQQ